MIKFRHVIFGLIRHGLTTAGGVLVTDGVATASDVNTIVGAIMTILGVLWSIWEKGSLMSQQEKAAVAAVARKSAPAILAAALLISGGTFLASCAGQSAQTATTESLITACNGYATSLHILTDMKAKGQLNGATIAAVDDANKAVGTLCDPSAPPPTDPASAAAVVSREAGVLGGILATKGPGA